MEEPVARSVEFRDPLIGRVLQDRYRVLRALGRGGMGVVYLAEHVLIPRKVAIKILASHLTASEEALQRFHREARAAASVGDEHIAQVTDMGRLDDGGYYIVLEYLEGVDLAGLVAAEGPLPIERAVNIAAQICAGLEAVHEAGIVHRDLKPENIFLIRRRGSSDFVKILDFGICKIQNERQLTATGVTLGTPRFMSPEQLEARPDVDRRTDVYALGAILFFALSGEGPFDGGSLPHLLISIWSEPARPLREVRAEAPAALEALVARALDKNPSKRFADCREMRARLTELYPTLATSELSNSRVWALESGVRDNEVQSHDARDEPESESVIRLRRAARRIPRALLASTVFALVLSVIGALAYALYVAVSTPSTFPGARRRDSHHARDASSAPAIKPTGVASEAQRSIPLADSTGERSPSSIPEDLPPAEDARPLRPPQPDRALRPRQSRKEPSVQTRVIEDRSAGNSGVREESPQPPPPPRNVVTVPRDESALPGPAELKRVF